MFCSTAWETTEDDVLTVLDAHGLDVSDAQLTELHESLDHDAIIDGLLHLTDMDDQTDSMLESLEAQLIASGAIVAGRPIFAK